VRADAVVDAIETLLQLFQQDRLDEFVIERVRVQLRHAQDRE
jgi:hypothetical protein